MDRAKNNQKAEITIHSIQHDISEEATETVYTGEYHFLAGTHIITYHEYYQEDGELPSKTASLIKIGENVIHIAKKGAITTQMHFEPRKTYHGSYQTPFGRFEMVIDTEQISICEQDNEICADIRYFLSLNHCPVSKYTIHIQIRK